MHIQKPAPIVSLLLSLIAITLSLPVRGAAQTFTNLANFEGPITGNGAESPLIQGIDGNFYGTNDGGGPKSGGTVYKITPEGVLSTVYNFCAESSCPTSGYNPFGGVVQTADGTFYGTTYVGGTNKNGTVYKLTMDGALTTLHSFDGTDGSGVYAGLLLASDGNLYGTTDIGGANGIGTFFKITPAGVLTTLHNFAGDEGHFTYSPLIESSDGNFYGTSRYGGANGYGTVFRVTPAGTVTTLHSFDFSSNYNAIAGLVRGNDGNFYGATANSGSGFGNIFKITPNGTFTILYTFSGLGAYPYGTLIQATDGNFYGTSFYGGPGPDGIVFEITPSASLTDVYTFANDPGGNPYAGLLQATNGAFYGTTLYGGSDVCEAGCGTVFSLNTGLAPSVKTVPPVGKAGQTVVILGNNLTGSTAVSFNGLGAAYTVVSNTEIKATVPAGATSGAVSVTTATGTLTSNPQFLVVP